jgi:N-acetylmuramoyl-L-alanine amidase
MADYSGGRANFKTMTRLEKILLFFLELFRVIRSAPTTAEVEKQEKALRAAIDTTMEAQSQMDDIVDEMPIDSSEPKETPAPLFVIRNHKFIDVPAHPSPNFGGVIEPQYLIIHYTANGSLSETIRHFNKASSEVSAHIVIDRDGTVVQCVSFDRAAWHCGVSRWDDLAGMNGHTIGIELVNWGRLKYRDGKYYTWAGQEVPQSQTVWLPRKVDGKAYFWQTYTDAQVHACFDVAAAIVKEYGLMGILGHDDISPRRKDDPGPAFDMTGLREYVARKNGIV